MKVLLGSLSSSDARSERLALPVLTTWGGYSLINKRKSSTKNDEWPILAAKCLQSPWNNSVDPQGSVVHRLGATVKRLRVHSAGIPSYNLSSAANQFVKRERECNKFALMIDFGCTHLLTYFSSTVYCK